MRNHSLQQAISNLAALFEFGALKASTAPAEFMDDARKEILCLRAELAALRAEKVSQCGHPPSLMLRSAETGKALYCELCDERKRRRDAESMEEHYKARAEKAEAEVERLRAALRELALCANTVGGCYTRNPGNFAGALRDMRDSSARAWELIDAARGNT